MKPKPNRSATDSDRSPVPADRRFELGPHSRAFSRGALGNVNGNSREGKFIRTLERQLVAHVGGKPSATERLIINRLTRVTLRLELFDEKIISGEPMTDHDARVYGALHNAHRLLLQQLGLKSAAAKGLSLADMLEEKRAARGAVASL